jgi:ABC-type dipeptide/oligopeptide/nickel transport system permease component
MGRYLLRRLLIAVPSLLGISVVLFVVLAPATRRPASHWMRANPSEWGGLTKGVCLRPDVAPANFTAQFSERPWCRRQMHCSNGTFVPGIEALHA